MPKIEITRRGVFNAAVALIHAAVVAFILIVPINAVTRAIWSLCARADGSGLSELIDVHRWRILLANTSIVCVCALVTALLLGGGFGFLIARTNLPGRKILHGAALLGACVPLYVSVVFIFALIPIWQYKNSTIACGVMHGLILSPLATVILAAVFRAGDRDLEDQARLDAGAFCVFRRITLPHAGWGVVGTGIVVALLTATDHTIADILIVRTFAEEVYTQFILDRTETGPILVGVPVMIFLAGAALLAQRRYRFFGDNAHQQDSRTPRRLVLEPWRGLVGAAAWAVMLALMVPPAYALLSKIGWSKEIGRTIAPLQMELWHTFIAAAAGAAAIVLFSIGLAWATLRARRARWAVFIAVIILLGMPAPVIGISLVDLLNRSNWLGAIYDSPFGVIIGYFVRFLPLGVLMMIPAVQRVALEHEHAARVDGCDWRQTQWHLYWPAVWKHAAIVGLVMMILCYGEVASTVLVAQPGWQLASVRAYTLIHFGVYRDLAVLAVMSIVYILLPWALLVALLRRWLAETTG